LQSLAINQAQVLRGEYGFDGTSGVGKNTSSKLETSAQSTSNVIDSAHDTGLANETRQGQLNAHTDSDDRHDGSSRAKAGGKSTQTVVNTDRYYRTPFFESQAQYERARVSLIDEQFKQFLDGQSLPRLTQVFANELQSLDADVYRLQVAFLSTILM